MRRGTTLIGKPVMSLEEGRQVDTVKDVVIGAGHQQVVALIVDEGGLLSSSRVVPLASIASFGRDSVVIPDSTAVLSASDVPEIQEVLDRKDTLLGKKVFTATGEEEGSVSDLLFDEESGRIMGLEVSRGPLGDVTRGRIYLPVDDIDRMGSEALFVSPAAAATIESPTGGIEGALQTASAKAQAAGSTVAERAGSVADRAGGAARSLSERTSQTVADRAAETRPEDRLVGRRAARDVLDERGRVLVAAGQGVGQADVDRARDAGRLRQLAAAVAAWEAEQANAEAGDMIDEASERVGSVWDQFVRRVSEMTDATGERFDEERTKRRLADIEDAIGRPVTKVILDRADNVILDLGEIITHEAVQRAHDARALDALLACVYRGEITFDRNEIRVGQSGSAAVERARGDAPILDELGRKVDTAEQRRSRQSEERRVAAEEARVRRERERAEQAERREQRRAGRAADREGAAATTGESPSVRVGQGRS